jgi:hypothetical protein
MRSNNPYASEGFDRFIGADTEGLTDQVISLEAKKRRDYISISITPGQAMKGTATFAPFCDGASQSSVPCAQPVR